MVVQFVLKSLYEVVVLPLTIRVVKAIKKVEGVDTFDAGVSYNPLKIKDI